MRKEYDFTKSQKNPYASQLKQQVTIRLETSVVDYFKDLAKAVGISYQNLINLFLKECAQKHKQPTVKWA